MYVVNINLMRALRIVVGFHWCIVTGSFVHVVGTSGKVEIALQHLLRDLNPYLAVAEVYVVSVQNQASLL